LGITDTERRPDYKGIGKILRDRYLIEINYKSIKVVKSYFNPGFGSVKLILGFNPLQLKSIVLRKILNIRNIITGFQLKSIINKKSESGRFIEILVVDTPEVPVTGSKNIKYNILGFESGTDCAVPIYIWDI